MIVEVKHTESNALSKVYTELKNINYRYPLFKSWFYDKVVPELELGYRHIITIQKINEIQATLILKDSYEKKICTLWVAEKYRNLGLGTQLIDLARQKLGTNYPLITVSGEHLHEFKPLFKKFGFRSECQYPNYYTTDSVEYCLNGELVKY